MKHFLDEIDEVLTKVTFLFIFESTKFQKYTLHVTYIICRTVKLTSPNLNYVIVVGAIVLMSGGLLVPGFPLKNKEKQAIICEVCKLSYIINM